MKNQADNWNEQMDMSRDIVALNPEGFQEIRQCRYGLMMFNKNDWPIGTSLRNYGEYAMEELDLLAKLIPAGGLVVDAGANIGTHTLWFSKHAGAVVSFEPQRIAFQTMCANAALNNCTNVYAINAAVGKEKGFITVPVRDQYAGNNFGGVPLAGVTEGEQVQLMTIDSLNLIRCDLIKADVEGMEGDLIEGAKETITKFRPLMYLEADGAQADKAKGLLIEMGYELYWHVPMLFSRNNFAGKKEDIFMNPEGKPLVSVNMLCLPTERKIQVIGLKRIESADEPPYMVVNVAVEEANA